MSVPKVFPNLDIENSYDQPVCGIDEVGRGPLAGPVVAAAVILKPEAIGHDALSIINDSKKISAKKRQMIAAVLPDIAYIGIGSATVREIETHNIYQCTFIAMARAYSALLKTAPEPPCLALIDGNKAPDIPCHTQTIIKGDQKSISIAAASIIAKEYRDTIMKDLAKEYPAYGWERNSGYGTKQHLNALKSQGITPHHRKNFNPIKSMISIN